jgi:hypothetical protein
MSGTYSLSSSSLEGDAILDSSNNINSNNDNASVVSDLQTATFSTAKGSAQLRKAVSIINTLKQEKSVLRNALDKANMTDLAVVRTKLRQTTNDNARLKELNGELKDRVQVLEAKLFESLQLQTKNNANAANAKESTSDSFSSSSASASDSHRQLLENAAVTKKLKTKCSHLTRLVTSYETRFREMQVKSNSKRSKPCQLSLSFASLYICLRLCLHLYLYLYLRFYMFASVSVSTSTTSLPSKSPSLLLHLHHRGSWRRLDNGMIT